MKLSRLLVACSTVLVLTLTCQAARAEQPLHERIDHLIAGGMVGQQPGPGAENAEFLRRVYLDLAGRIPTVEEARRFLRDPRPEKRSELIDRLLSGPEYPRRMQELFHVMLMERRGDDQEWLRFLRAAFAWNMPWDQMVRTIVKPNADDEETRGAAYFTTARLVSEGAMAAVDVPGLTRDVGRLLAGVDLQCAQCHDHISINAYTQRDFQGLHMVFENVQTRRDVKFPALAEKLMTGEKEFMSVFTRQPMNTSPRVPGGGEIEIVVYPKGDEYAVPPDRKKRTPGEPKFSPLGELAARLTAADNQLFGRNIVNRLWFVMMGRGLVEPLDLLHPENPPTHPELLDLLTEEFAAHEFDVRWLLRELALSQTYQRTSIVPEEQDAPPATCYAVANEKRLAAEQLFWSSLIATGELERLRTRLAAREEKVAGERTAEQIVAAAEEATALRQLFVKAFANPPKEPEIDFEPTVKAALFLMHDERVLALLQKRPGNLLQRLSNMTDSDAIAEELFLAILTRQPSPQDRRDVAKSLAGKEEELRDEALGHLVWALLTSTEFCVNH